MMATFFVISSLKCRRNRKYGTKLDVDNAISLAGKGVQSEEI